MQKKTFEKNNSKFGNNYNRGSKKASVYEETNVYDFNIEPLKENKSALDSLYRQPSFDLILFQKTQILFIQYYQTL